ncbi:MAG: hypothetical protein ABIT58_03940 [Ferruginibacter sp.]
MTSLEILLEAFKVYEIKIIAIEGNLVKLQNNFTVEVEKNKMYKLFDDGYIVAPFGDLNELCRFILNG